MSRLIKISRILGLRASVLSQTRLSSSSPVAKETLFFDNEVQSLMKKLTGLNLEKVFRRRKLGRPSERPIYHFMTQEVKFEVERLAGNKEDCLVSRSWRRLRQRSGQRLRSSYTCRQVGRRSH